MLGDQTYHYLTTDEMKSLGDDSMPIDVTNEEQIEPMMIQRDSHLGTVYAGTPFPLHFSCFNSSNQPAILFVLFAAPPGVSDEDQSPLRYPSQEAVFTATNYTPDNVDISRTPVYAG